MLPRLEWVQFTYAFLVIASLWVLLASAESMTRIWAKGDGSAILAGTVLGIAIAAFADAILLGALGANAFGVFVSIYLTIAGALIGSFVGASISPRESMRSGRH